MHFPYLLALWVLASPAPSVESSGTPSTVTLSEPAEAVPPSTAEPLPERGDVEPSLFANHVLLSGSLYAVQPGGSSLGADLSYHREVTYRVGLRVGALIVRELDPLYSSDHAGPYAHNVSNSRGIVVGLDVYALRVAQHRLFVSPFFTWERSSESFDGPTDDAIDGDQYSTISGGIDTGWRWVLPAGFSFGAGFVVAWVDPYKVRRSPTGRVSSDGAMRQGLYLAPRLTLGWAF